MGKYWKSLAVSASAVFIGLGSSTVVAQSVKCGSDGKTCFFEYNGHTESCEKMICQAALEAYKKYFDDKENARKHEEEMARINKDRANELEREKVKTELERARLKHEEEMKQKEAAHAEQMEKLRCGRVRQTCRHDDRNKERECIQRERCREY
jgi:hypothetical protein